MTELQSRNEITFIESYEDLKPVLNQLFGKKARIQNDDPNLRHMAFADAYNVWYCQTHYQVVKWLQWVEVEILPTIISGLHYYFINMPFVLIWVLSLLLWFFSELTSLMVEYFNLKHVYQLVRINYMGVLLGYLKLLNGLPHNLFNSYVYRYL